MADCLMITQNDGTVKPVGVIQGDASDIKYDENTTVKEKIDSMTSITDITNAMTMNVSYNTNYSFVYIKNGVAYMQFFITEAVDGSKNYLIGTLPSGYRPGKQTWTLAMPVGGGTQNQRVTIDTNGQIKSQQDMPANSFFNVSYIIQ